MGRKWRETYPGSGEYEEVDTKAEGQAALFVIILIVLGFPWGWLGYKIMRDESGCGAILMGLLLFLIAFAQVVGLFFLANEIWG